MICKKCRKAAKKNRKIFTEHGWVPRCCPMKPHPENCGCPCQHRVPTQWEDMFSVERPK